MYLRDRTNDNFIFTTITSESILFNGDNGDGKGRYVLLTLFGGKITALILPDEELTNDLFQSVLEYVGIDYNEYIIVISNLPSDTLISFNQFKARMIEGVNNALNVIDENWSLIYIMTIFATKKLVINDDGIETGENVFYTIYDDGELYCKVIGFDNHDIIDVSKPPFIIGTLSDNTPPPSGAISLKSISLTFDVPLLTRKMPINFTTNNTSGEFSIQFSDDGGTTWSEFNTLTGTTTGVVDTKVVLTPMVVTGNHMFRVVDSHDDSIVSNSLGLFIAPIIDLTKVEPNPGNASGGSDYTIVIVGLDGSYAGPKNVILEYSFSSIDGWVVFHSLLMNNTSSSKILNITNPTSGTVYLRAKLDYSGTGVYVISDTKQLITFP